jgi:hypothetical protein
MERSTGDTDSGSSGSLSILQTLGVGAAHGELGAAGSSSSIAGLAADGGSSSLSLPSTVQHVMTYTGKLPQQPVREGQWQPHLQPVAQQQQQQAADEAKGAEGMPLAPIQEEDEASSSMASELLSASTQGRKHSSSWPVVVLRCSR